jgi:hypothetical protein
MYDLPLMKEDHVNVFVCHPDPSIASQMLADRHVVKMTVETAQVLSAVAQLSGVKWTGMYRLTHKHHPVVRAALDQPGYLAWVVSHGMSLGEEYTFRYGKTHSSHEQIIQFIREWHRDIATYWDLKVFPQCLPEGLRVVGDPVQGYRNHLTAKYTSWGESARWKVRGPPTWFHQGGSK